jgi:hypothetical protein
MELQKAMDILELGRKADAKKSFYEHPRNFSLHMKDQMGDKYDKDILEEHRKDVIRYETAKLIYDKFIHECKKQAEIAVYGGSKSQMITIMLDQRADKPKVINLLNKIIKIKSKWLEGAKGVIEFTTKESEWAPHIHIFVDKQTDDGKLAQALRRIKEFKNDRVDRLNVKTGLETYQSKYIDGDKKESKNENCLKDKILREKFNLPNLIKFFS